MWSKVLLRWSTQRGLSVIPKSNSQHRLQQNLDVTSFDLKADEIQSISDLDKNLKFNVPTNVSDPASVFFLILSLTARQYGIPCYVFA